VLTLFPSTMPHAARLALDHVGDTDLIRAGDVWAKLECMNPTGSVKDRVARFLLLEAVRRGELVAGDVVVEATSGNTGIAMAWVARALGCQARIYMPEHMSPERRRMMEQLGAEVRLTSRERSFAGAVAERDAWRGRPGHYVPDQFGNPDNTRCHRETTGVELVRQLCQHGVTPDVFVAGVGTGGTLMGVGAALREAFPRMLRVAVEPAESAVLSGGPAGDHAIMGIGDGFVPALLDIAEVDAVECVSSAEALAAAESLRHAHGTCVGVSSGANMVAAARYAARGLTAVTLWPDSADRYRSMGLCGAGSPDVRCAHAERCRRRMLTLLGAAGP
jgi:cysteine synthase A